MRPCGTRRRGRIPPRAGTGCLARDAIEIGETPAEVDVRFNDVRLNARVPVVHKHGVGSCSGELVANPGGRTWNFEDPADRPTALRLSPRRRESAPG
jgi:hypothetical protein